jgi:hypothetical protein
MANKPYVGDVGTIIEADMGAEEDLTMCNSLCLYVKKPNGLLVTWTSTIVTTTTFHTIINSGDFNIKGIYKANPWGKFPGWEGRGETFEFEVFEAFK